MTIPNQIRVDINSPHTGKEIKLFANKYNDGTTGLLIGTTSTRAVETGGMQDILWTKILMNAVVQAHAAGSPYYWTISVGPLDSTDQIFGAQVNWQAL
jgi:hypothetical protein